MKQDYYNQYKDFTRQELNCLIAILGDHIRKTETDLWQDKIKISVLKDLLKSK